MDSEQGESSSSSFDIKKETVVFVSYVREESEAADRLCQDLKNANLNLKPWIDRMGIIPGQNWEEVIYKAIQSCRYFIPLISSKANEKNGYTKKEFQYALKVIRETQQNKKIIVIPVMLNECKIPYPQLQKIQSVNLFPVWKEGFEKLLQAIKQGDNLVDESQFKQPRKITRITQIIRHPLNRNSLRNTSLSPAMLQLLDSDMTLDKNSIVNPHYTNSDHQRLSFSPSRGLRNRSSGSKDGQFNRPTGIAMDGSSNHIYVADKDNHRIQKFDSGGRGFITKWGSKGSGDGQFTNPESLCINRQIGSICIVEPNNHRIQLLVIPLVEEWIRKGTFSYSSHNYYEALECFEKSTIIDQNYGYAWVNRGKCLIHMGRYQDAVKSFEKSIGSNKNNVQGLINEGVTHYILNKYDKAIKCFDRSLEITHRNGGALYFRGCSKVKKGQVEEGIQDISSAIKIDQKMKDYLSDESGLESITERLGIIT